MNRTFVSFVEHDDRVLREIWIQQALSQKHTICHILDDGLWRCTIFETDSVTDFFSESATELFCDTLGDRHSRHTTWLSTADLAPLAEAVFDEILSHLRRFTRTSFSNDYKDLIVSHGLEQL